MNQISLFLKSIDAIAKLAILQETSPQNYQPTHDISTAQQRYGDKDESIVTSLSPHINNCFAIKMSNVQRNSISEKIRITSLFVWNSDMRVIPRCLQNSDQNPALRIVTMCTSLAI